MMEENQSRMSERICQDAPVCFSMEEGQYSEGQQDLCKDTMMKIQPPLKFPDGSSNRNPPETCTGPLSSKDCPPEDHIMLNHYQFEGTTTVKVEFKKEEMNVSVDQHSLDKDKFMEVGKEEEETYGMSAQQLTENSIIVATIKDEEEKPCVRGDQQSTEESKMVRTIKEEEEEAYERSDQLPMEEGDIMGTIKKEEKEMYERDDQLSTEEDEIMRIIKVEDDEEYGYSGWQSIKYCESVKTIKEEEFSVDICTGRCSF
ncbi:uncharacterized protein [Hyperolius riggenbachi]|uniref:uncharacterized protein isoform X2 n=1 Tax=Hyperolius riggenbachi TaxID=752182 RepID=UPI0035A301E6